MSVRAASSHNTAEPKYDMLVSSMTYIAHKFLDLFRNELLPIQGLLPDFLLDRSGVWAVLGNVVISKNFLRTRKIMVMA